MVCAKLRHIDIRQQAHENGIHRIGRAGDAGRAGGFPPRRGRRQIELQLLRIAQRDEHDRVAAGGDHVLGQADDGETIAAELDALAKVEPGAAIGDRLVAAAQDRTAGHQPGGLARTADLGAHDQQALGGAAVLRFDVLIGDRARGGDAPLRGNDIAAVAGQSRRLRERAARAALDHPDMGTGGAREPQRFQHEPAIDADHCEHDAEQQAEADAGQQKASKIVPDVLERQIHVITLPRRPHARRGPRAFRAARRSRWKRPPAVRIGRGRDRPAADRRVARAAVRAGRSRTIQTTPDRPS